MSVSAHVCGSTRVPPVSLPSDTETLSRDSRPLVSPHPAAPPFQQQAVLLFSFQDTGGRAPPTRGRGTPVRHSYSSVC